MEIDSVRTGSRQKKIPHNNAEVVVTERRNKGFGFTVGLFRMLPVEKYIAQSEVMPPS